MSRRACHNGRALACRSRPLGLPSRAAVVVARIAALAFTVLLLVVFPAGATSSVPAFRSAFHSEQCARAIAFAQQQLCRDPANHYAQLIRGEGLLCLGLEDDLWALDAALVALRRLSTETPTDFFAAVALADGLRRRFPLADETPAAMERAARVLAASDVGRARGELAAYLEQNRRALADYREASLSRLRELLRTHASGDLDADGVATLANLLVQTGSGGLLHARAVLEAFLARRWHEKLATLTMAETLRGVQSPPESIALYRLAADRFCLPAEIGGETPECSLARLRVEQLTRQASRHFSHELSKSCEQTDR